MTSLLCCCSGRNKEFSTLNPKDLPESEGYNDQNASETQPLLEEKEQEKKKAPYTPGRSSNCSEPAVMEETVTPVEKPKARRSTTSMEAATDGPKRNSRKSLQSLIRGKMGKGNELQKLRDSQNEENVPKRRTSASSGTPRSSSRNRN